MGKKPKPTLRQRRLMRNLLAGQNFTESAIQAGYSPVTVAKKGRTLLRPEQWADVLHLAGLDDPTLAALLHDLIHAKSKKFFAYEGEAIESEEFIDWDARARGLDMALRIREAYPQRDSQADKASVGVKITMHGMNPRALRPPGIQPPALQKAGNGDAGKRRNAGGRKALRSAPPQGEQGTPVPGRP